MTRTLPPGRSNGFSLLELVVVLVLMGLAAAIILPSFSGGLSSLELETSARDLVTRMKQARSEAIAQQQVRRVILHSGSQSSSYTLANAYEEEIKSFPLPQGVMIQTGASEESLTVSFYPTGRSSGGNFGLKNQRGKELRILVDPITGFARAERPLDADSSS